MWTGSWGPRNGRQIRAGFYLVCSGKPLEGLRRGVTRSLHFSKSLVDCRVKARKCGGQGSTCPREGTMEMEGRGGTADVFQERF